MASVNRRVFSQMYGKHLGPIDQGAVQMADLFVDEALSALDDEEPGLRAWLERDPQVQGMLKANNTALYKVVDHAMRNGAPPTVYLETMAQLVFRAVAAIAWRAALRERESASEWSPRV